ncbi:DUF1624 domain-containing protein [Paraglaciecola arctica]|uniref:Heparan-alpha-glucosaminide N-acetyltransferase catalytic domain-containing protein n=1 Tax=Paraglaciecola arctica BSs20135 TaxID=493475 RepID=K6YGR4_9ALTE|nr:heparan-alpha-glucosaminide N-acetyltransferase [Paraglaciecola arctica]GAC17337.1 hypothetical protein GARC_0355 [Paraglaciecola arctica BSs20135]
MGKISNNNVSRNYEIDLLRGIAIVLMIIFHFSYDLTMFGWAFFNTGEDIEWRIFRTIIVSGFLLAVGMSSYLAYQKSINQKKLAKTVGKLFCVSLLITIGSLFMDPNTWVYFGIIHFITVALPISVLFVRIPNIALIVGSGCILGYWLGILNFDFIWDWSVLHLGIPSQTVDLVSLFPWIGVVLIGVFVMHNEIFNIKFKPRVISNKLVFLGQHSLLIYLIHQPILYGLFGLVDVILGR